MVGKAERVEPATALSVCEVCRDVRPATEIVSLIRAGGKDSGRVGHRYYVVAHCKDRPECRAQAEALADAFQAGT